MQQFIVLILFTSVTFGLGFLLSYASKKYRVESGNPTAELINKSLPQVQCGQCGYVGCSEYALAIAEGKAPINLCTPGGDMVIKKIAGIMHIPEPKPDGTDDGDLIASIDKSLCIGCTKCSKVCPYDAIVGQLKQAHTVNPNYCMGCKKCIDTCPKKCIAMVIPDPTTDTWNWVIEAKENKQ